MSELFNLQLSEKMEPVLEAVKAFIAIEISPVEQEFHDSPKQDNILSLIHI